MHEKFPEMSVENFTLEARSLKDVLFLTSRQTLFCCFMKCDTEVPYTGNIIITRVVIPYEDIKYVKLSFGKYVAVYHVYKYQHAYKFFKEQHFYTRL